MAKRSKRYSAFYTFLAPYLERGNETEIKLAKLAYRKMYKANWRKAQRSNTKSFTISYSTDELKELLQIARRHKLKPTRFIKYATEAYINKRYIVPNQEEVNKLIQLVALTYNVIDSIGQENKIDVQSIKKMQEELFQLEHEIRVAIFSPKTIEQVISEEIAKDVTTKAYLISFLETIKHDN
jgi:hypothetical protein